MSRWLFDAWMVLPDWAVWALIVTLAVLWALFAAACIAYGTRPTPPAHPSSTPTTVVLFPARPRPYDWATDGDAGGAA